MGAALFEGRTLRNRVAARFSKCQMFANDRMVANMTTQQFTIFDTAIGACGIVWSGPRITGVQLPEREAGKTRARLLRRNPDARETSPPPDIQRVIDDIVALLRGEPRDLSGIDVAIETVPEFNQRVYAIARTIPPGQTLSYGDIATQLGDRLLARDVGQALGQNPFPIIVPCHRVLAAGGKMGGFSAPGGIATKLKLLSIERAEPNGPTLFDDLPLVARRGARA
jgi:methylated-DNA-[protein]-cysteine S-methyltransferase